jgi:hypothetical protein
MCFLPGVGSFFVRPVARRRLAITAGNGDDDATIDDRQDAIGDHNIAQLMISGSQKCCE